MATVAELIIRARDEASAIMRQVQQSARESGQAIKAAFKGLGKVGEDLAKIGAAGLGAFGLAAKSSADFQSELKKTMTMTGLSGGAFVQMEKKVSDLANTFSIEFGTKSQDVLKSFYYVLSTGSQVGTEAFKVLSSSALKLSKVVGTDLSSAVTYIADTTKQWGKAMEESGHTAEVLFRASQLGNTTVDQLAEGLKNCGSAAAGVGISMEDTVSIMIALSDKAIKAGEAGTGLRSIFVKLAAPTAEASKALAQLGVSVFDTSGKMRPILDIFREMQSKMKGLNQATQEQILVNIGGQESFNAFKAILGSNIDSINGYSGELQKASALQEGMTQTQKTLTFQLERLRESFSQIVRVIGDALLPSITKGIKALTSFTQGVMAYIKEHPQMVAMIAKWGAIGSAVALALGAALIGISAFVAKAIQIAGTIGSLLAAAFSPIGIGIALMLAGVYAAWQQNFGGIRDFTTEIVKVLQDSWGKLWEYMKQGKAEEMLTVFQGAWDKIKELFTTKIDEVKTKFQEFGAGIKALFEPLKTAVAPAIQPIASGIKTIVSSIRDFLKDHPGFVAALKEWGPPLAAISGALVVITPLIGSLAGGMSSLLGPLGGVLVALRGIGLFFASNPIGIALGIFAGLYAAWQADLWGIQQIVKDTVAKVQEWWNGFVAWMEQSPAAGKAKELWGAVGKAITDAFAYLTGPEFKSKIQAALDWLSNAWQSLVKFLQPVINEITKVLWPELVKIWDILVQAAKDFWVEFQPQIEQLWMAIKDLTERIMELLGPYLPSILALLQTGLKLIIDAIALILKDFAKILKGTLMIISKVINDWILPLTTAIIKTIDDMIFGITETIKAIKAAIEKYFVKPISDAYAAYYKAKTDIIELWEGIKQAIDKALKYIASAIDKWVQDKFGYWLKKIEEIKKLISDVQALTNGTAGNSNAQFTDTAAATANISASRAASAATAASRGMVLNNPVIITSSSSARQLEKDLSKYTVQRLARGAV